MQGAAGFGGALAEDGEGGGRLGRAVAGDGAFHDAGFVPGDFFDSRAQHGGVVDAEAGDAGHGGGVEDVGAVVGAADTAFDYGGVDAFGHVGVQGHEG